jgi:hypothetical protein
MMQFRAKPVIGLLLAAALATECAGLDSKQHVEQKKVEEEARISYTVSNSTMAAPQLINSIAELPDGSWI